MSNVGTNRLADQDGDIPAFDFDDKMEITQDEQVQSGKGTAI
jgi:hypothetical protein